MLKLCEIKTLLEIDFDIPEGLRWRVRNNKALRNMPAGTLNSGYYCTQIKGERYKNHRIIYALYHDLELDQLPKFLDHIDQNKTNNKPENLRPATRSQNHANRKKYKNNKCGIKGVTWHKQRKKYCAQIGYNGDVKHLGLYNTKEEAFEAYKLAAYHLFGDYANIT